MSISVKIEHEGGAFGREVKIERVTGEYTGWRELNVRDTYKVTLLRMVTKGNRDYMPEDQRFIGTTTIQHRYGDNLLVLVQEAMDALIEAEFEKSN